MNYEKYFSMKNKDIIYFDNAATTFKPDEVIDAMDDYYKNYSSNAHRGDYNISFKVNDEIEETREMVSEFINARSKDEIIFTYGATDSLNMVVDGFFEHYLNYDDEIILTKSEHASNVIPWLVLAKKKNLKIKYISLDDDNKVTMENFMKVVSEKSKVISLASITNTIGDERDIEKISSYAHENGIYVVVDAAQSVGHTSIDVRKYDADFVAFSAHKMYGPTGIGILYAKYELLKKMMPVRFGGGMNKDFSEDSVSLVNIPYRFEAGTQNISAIIGLKAAIKFINRIGINNINKHEEYLKEYLVRKLKLIPHVKIYNANTTSNIVLINVDNVLSGDLGLYLNSKNICVRSGKHCVKLLHEEKDINDTVRISLSFYNSYEEIDKLIEALSDYEKILSYVKQQL